MSFIPFTRLVLTKKIASDVEGFIKIKVTVPHTTRHKYKSTGHKINEGFWDAKQECVLKGCPLYQDINWEITKEKNKIVAAFDKDYKDGTAFTEALILKRLDGSDLDAAADFYSFCRTQIGLANYSKETRRTYESEVLKLEKFSATLAFADITYPWLQRYEQYMRTKLSNHNNTVWKSLKFISTMMNRAKKVGGIIDKSPFEQYDRGKYKQGVPVFLQWNEVVKFHDTVKNKPLSDTVRLIGYYSLLSYYTGLRYSDAVSFDYNKKVLSCSPGDKDRRLLLYAKKNNELVSILFNSYIAEVVDYIKDRPIKITNQEFNEGLKIIAGVAEINKEISSHTGRHSFAVRCAELNASIDEVQRLLGHNKRSSTEIYFRIQDKRTDDVMKRWEPV